ncbi:MAG: alanine/glycine:cation symporter family protein [Wenzhouxiangellaceae bacterium]|nr:alanine/glycine:cation symporter family protein [Wenzhouxiangellaceae bacterium]
MTLSRIGLALPAVLASTLVTAQEGVDSLIDRAVTPLSDGLSAIIFYEIPLPYIEQGVPFIVLWLVVAALFFTFYFGFINLRAMKHAFRLVRGDYTSPDAAGEVTHFQALATALSGTVGLGNIAGVALAVSLGGPGATFWMILAGLLGMSTKFVECTLGVKYRNEYADGTVSGGPMYYLSKGVAEEYPSLVLLGKALAVVFAVFCIGGTLGAGAMFQTNQAFSQLLNVTGGETSALNGYGWLFGLVIALLVGMVIIGGIKSIARVTEKIVPIMGVLYVSAGLLVIGMNIEHLPAAFGSIISGAFRPEGVYGGFVGVLIMGFRRAAFSNEAGVGSAAIAHAAVRTDKPVTEGLVALYEPFIDTVVVCTITALVIIITGSLVPGGNIEGVALTSRAFSTAFDWFPMVLLLAVLLFAFSTTISWSYYGLKSFTYLFGEGRNKELVFKAVVLASIVVGSSINLASVMDFADAMILAMALPNLVGVYLLTPVVKRELKTYWADYKAGRLQTYPQL